MSQEPRPKAAWLYNTEVAVCARTRSRQGIPCEPLGEHITAGHERHSLRRCLIAPLSRLHSQAEGGGKNVSSDVGNHLRLSAREGFLRREKTLDRRTEYLPLHL
ncbi:hypothetical protein PsYK624_078640 [Phanerochaete sordida]|uniref:Uncharacterized protein n=1 Tax=Phanerochaete sordida TaxID=48140 RepID=A0A9P3GDB0_9APHY|nr:hypothetical protein PsYK624_078640 [Phanerochaete sordida]